jgi:saccharopine dehydrogenase-like NADP-dependent oxidoreductase
MNPVPNGTVNVAVLGAAGTIAPAIVADLAASDEVGGMVLLDLDAGKAQAVSEVHGGGKSAARATDPHFGLGGSIVSTAAPIAAAVRLLGRGSLTAVGARPPELCIDPDEMFAELETRGCTFSVQR